MQGSICCCCVWFPSRREAPSNREQGATVDHRYVFAKNTYYKAKIQRPYDEKNRLHLVMCYCSRESLGYYLNITNEYCRLHLSQ